MLAKGSLECSERCHIIGYYGCRHLRGDGIASYVPSDVHGCTTSWFSNEGRNRARVSRNFHLMHVARLMVSSLAEQRYDA